MSWTSRLTVKVVSTRNASSTVSRNRVLLLPFGTTTTSSSWCARAEAFGSGGGVLGVSLDIVGAPEKRGSLRSRATKRYQLRNPAPRRGRGTASAREFRVAREVAEARETELVEERLRRPVLERVTGDVGAPGDLDERAVDEVAQDRADLHSPDRLDLGLRHRLAVRDDRERLEGRRRDALRLALLEEP